MCLVFMVNWFYFLLFSVGFAFSSLHIQLKFTISDTHLLGSCPGLMEHMVTVYFSVTFSAKLRLLLTRNRTHTQMGTSQKSFVFVSPILEF